MTISKTLHRTLTVALATASLALLTTQAVAAPAGQLELVNRPAAPGAFVCRTDEGYGRWTSCDHGH